MGLSIHYKGKFKNYALIDEMVVEVVDICKSMNWKYQVFDIKKRIKKKSNPVKYTPHDVKGISFTPEESETVFLTALPDATLCCPIKLIYYNPVNNDLMIEWVSVKTQFAGPEVHISILKLLKYLNDKYFENFEMNDEGLYWEHWDEKALLSQFSRYNFLLNSVAAALSNVKLAPGEKAESLVDRIEEILKKKFDTDETH